MPKPKTHPHREWPLQARGAMEQFIEAVKADLPPDATIAQIEQAVLEHHRALLSEVMQALADASERSPPRDNRS